MEKTALVGPLPWLIAALGVVGSGRMIFEGLRALTLDEATRSSPQQIQQLGAWARVLVESGIRPRGAAMNAIFIGSGLVWLAFTVAFALGAPWARWGLFAAAIGSLWYLSLGTMLSLVLIALLVIAGR